RMRAPAPNSCASSTSIQSEELCRVTPDRSGPDALASAAGPGGTGACHDLSIRRHAAEMTSEHSHTPVRKAAVIFIFVTVMIDMLAFGIIIPVFPHLVQHMTGGDIATAVRWTGIMGALFGFMQFVFSPVQGALSDRFGRRPVVLASNLALGLDFILMAMAQTLPILFIGRVISGM